MQDMLRKGETIIIVFRETNYRISYIRWELLVNQQLSNNCELKPDLINSLGVPAFSFIE